MTKRIFTLSILLSATSWAGTFSDAGLEDLATGRAEVYIEKMETKKINLGALINSLKANHSSETCGTAQINVSRKDAIYNLGRNYYDNYDLSEKLKELHKKNLIKTAIEASDSADSSNSEYCSTTTFIFISVDGEKLTIYFDFNT